MIVKNEWSRDRRFMTLWRRRKQTRETEIDTISLWAKRLNGFHLGRTMTRVVTRGEQRRSCRKEVSSHHWLHQQKSKEVECRTRSSFSMNPPLFSKEPNLNGMHLLCV